MYFTLVKECNPNTILEVGDLIEACLADIAKHHNFSPENILLCTPNYWKPLTPDNDPFSIAPALILGYRPPRYPPPPYYLRQDSRIPQCSFCLGVIVKTQTDIDFPKIFVPLTRNEARSLGLDEFIQKCSTVFGYDNSEQELYIDETKCTNETKIREIIDAGLAGKLIFKTLLTETELRPIQHRVYLCQQLVESEEFYINTLDTMTKYWEPKFQDTKQFTEEEMKELFRLVPTMREAHQVFLNALKETPISFSQTVCDVFLNYMPYFKVSTPFISNYRSMDKWFQEKLKDKNFGKIYLDIERECPDDTGRSFSQYCVSPIQRYPKYNLILRDLDKKTPLFHPDKRYLQYTLEQLGIVIGLFNINSLKMDQTYLMNQIQKEIGSSFKLIQPRRNLIMSCAVKIVDLDNADGFFHLFNDIYIVTTQKDRTQEIVMTHPLYQLSFLEKGDTITVSQDRKLKLKFKQPAEIARLIDHMITAIPPTFAEIVEENNYIAWTSNETNDLAMTNHQGATIGDKIFWIGGRDAKNILTTEYVIFDPATNGWQRNQCPLPPRTGHSVGVIGDDAYILFGKTYQNMATDIWKFNGQTLEWTEIQLTSGNLQPRWGQSCVNWRGKLVFFGGMTPEQKFLNTVTIFDPQALTLEDVPTVHAPIGRCFHGAVMVDDDRMLIIGGNAGKMFPSEFDILDLTANEWVSVDIPRCDMKIMGLNFYCAKNGRYIYVFGGSMISSNIPPFAIDLITLRSLKLEQYGNCPDTIVESAFAVHGNVLYMFGGKESLTCNRNLPLVYSADLSIGQRYLPEEEPVFIIPPTSVD